MLLLSEDEFSNLIWKDMITILYSNTWKINLELGIFDKINLLYTHTSCMMRDIDSHTPVDTRNKLKKNVVPVYDMQVA